MLSHKRKVLFVSPLVSSSFHLQVCYLSVSLGLWFTVLWRKRPGMTKPARPYLRAWWVDLVLELASSYTEDGSRPTVQRAPAGKAAPLKPHKIKGFPSLLWNTQFPWVLNVWQQFVVLWKIFYYLSLINWKNNSGFCLPALESWEICPFLPLPGC